MNHSMNSHYDRSPKMNIAALLFNLFGCALITIGALTDATADAPPPPSTKATEVTAKAIPQMPGTGVEELAEVAQRDLAQLMGEGPCPCDPTKTLLVCIQSSSCPAATELAQLGVSLYKSGMGSEQVAEAVIKEYIARFMPPVEFDLSKSPSKGDPKAPITIVEFADFECPHCALMGEIMKEVVKERPQAVRVFFKQFPLPFHKMAPLASQATLAAHRQDAFWQMHDLIFKNQQDLSPEKFMTFAEELSLNMMIFRADFADPEVSKQIESEMEEGRKAGLQGTPTLFFNGKVYNGDPTKEAILAHIDQLMSKLKSKK